MPLIFNNVEIETVNFNGTPLDTININGVKVFEKNVDYSFLKQFKIIDIAVNTW